MFTLPKKLKIQYFSDIHLEFYDLTKIHRILHNIKPLSDICVLAGDIGYPLEKTYEVFLKGINSKFSHIFLIHGNHEYYQIKNNKDKNIEDIINKTNEIITSNNLNNIHFLNNSYYDIGKYRFVGSVLWTNIINEKYLINDSNYINNFTVKNNNIIYEKNKEFINNIIKDSIKVEKDIVMITHHLPSYKLVDPIYSKYHNYNQCFASDCEDLIINPIKCWIFGHTHTNVIMKINNINCIANPIGYSGENPKANYNKIIEI